MSKNIFSTYKKECLTAFSFNLGYTNNKKTVSNVPPFSTYEGYNKKYLDKEKTGTAIRTGLKYKDTNKYIILLDIDNKPDGTQLNGLTKWRELLNSHYPPQTENIIDINNNFNDIIYNEFLRIDTPTQRTGGGGLHYLFLVNAEQLNIIAGGITGLNIDNNNYQIDVKAMNGFLISEPSTYKTEDGTIKNYKWLKGINNNISDTPEWIFKIIKDNKGAPNKKQLITNRGENIQQTEHPIINIQIDKNIYEYFNLLNVKRFNNYYEWYFLLVIFKTYNLSYEIFLKRSRQSIHYITDEYIFNKWQDCKRTTKYNIKIIYSMAKNDSPEEFNKIFSNNKTIEQNDNLFNIDNYEQVIINNKYLINNNETDNIILDNIDKWQTNKDIKTLNIKSPYGSGKTQLLKTILNKYQQKRVLFITYRQTLTDNIFDEFKEYNFKSYLDKEFNADRQILQLESLQHLKQFYILEENDDGTLNAEIPYYDLIIIDEIEGVLNHFNSKTTFKGKEKATFNYLYDIIFNSNKLLCLDGDINARALSYASNFGRMITINNKYNTNDRKFNFMNNETNFKNKLLQSITEAKEQNKKIGLCSMSKTDTIKYYNIINEYFDNDINILIINSETGDEQKKELKDINKNILKYDVFIYSPSIEAGVNIDIDELFYSLFCIISPDSTSPRAFLQMTARIRKLINNDINILNVKMTNNNIPFYEYEELKEYMKTLNKLEMDRYIETIDGKRIEIFKLSPYNTLQIYNKLEKINGKAPYFIKLLLVMLNNKGINYTFETEAKKEKIITDKSEYYTAIINTPNISYDENENILKKIKNREATEDDKRASNKYYFMQKLNICNVDEDILIAYNKREYSIDNYINLMKGNNKDIKTLYIYKLLNNLGFDNMNDDRNITENDINKNIINIINDRTDYNITSKQARITFNKPKDKQITINELDTATRRKYIMFINSLLNCYNLKVEAQQDNKRESGKNKKSIYNLMHINNIQEIIFYKTGEAHNKNIEFVYKHLRQEAEEDEIF
jgi:hypothetical protein